MVAALGKRSPAVPWTGAGDADDGGEGLALAWVDGHLPGYPWTDEEIALVRHACERVAALPSSTLDGLDPGRLVDDLLGDERLQAALDGGLTMPASLEHLPQWLPSRVGEVLELARHAQTLLVGDHLNHFDLRPDNLLIGRGPGDVTDRAYVLDWNWVTIGPAWCDWVGIIPTMHDQGYELADLMASSPLSRDADPDAIDAFLAVIAIYMLVGLGDGPPHGTIAALRHHQRYYSRIFRDSLAAHRPSV